MIAAKRTGYEIEQRKLKQKPDTERRTCGQCHVPKPLTVHHFGFTGDDGNYRSICRPCYSKQRQKAGKMKKCSKCQAVKERHDFYTSSRAKDGRQSHCKACDTARARSADGSASDKPGAWKEGKICGHCGSLPHRVEGPKCFKCGLRYEAEAAPEPMLTRYVDPVSGW